VPPEVRSLREKILAATSALSGETREQALPQVGPLKAQAQALYSDKPGEMAHELPDLVAQMQQKIAALPSEKPDPSLFQEPRFSPMPTYALDQAPLGREVSFREFMFRPPQHMTLDLKVNGIGKGLLVWRAAKAGGAVITLRAIHRTDPTQKQPWVTTVPTIAEAARQRRLFAIAGTPLSNILRAQINGVNFVRVGPPIGATARFQPLSEPIQYATLDGDDWVVMELKDDSVVHATLDASMMSIRRRNSGEARADPLSPAMLAARLGSVRLGPDSDADNVKELLIQQGPAAEDALIPLLTSSWPVAESAAQILQSVGTAKSVPALKVAAHSPVPGLAEAARAALRVVAPKKFDAVGEAVLDLNSHRLDSDALAKLAAAPPDEARRAAIEARLEELFFATGATANAKDLGKALGVWRTDHSTDIMLKVLDNPKSEVWMVQVAMSFAGTGADKRLVFPVVHWINTPQFGETSVQTLISMGAVAEEETIKVSRVNDMIARTNAARVLAKIGTKRCIPTLTVLSNDTRNPSAAAAASSALLEVHARSTATTAPAK
jgi:hypothetical protein